MQTFSNFELSNLLSGRFRLDDKHKPVYLAECLQRMSPSLNRTSLSSITEELEKANGRAFNSSRLPIRGETLNLSFFFELWKRNFRFEGSIYDKFVFTDELKLAFKINPRDFWEALIRADRELGTLLKDSYIAYNLRELPKEMSINSQLRGNNVDLNIIRRLKEKLPTGKDTVTSLEITKTTLQIFGVPNPSDSDIKQTAEKLEKENGIKRLSGEPFSIIPKKALDKLSTKSAWEYAKQALKILPIPMNSSYANQTLPAKNNTILPDHEKEKKENLLDHPKIQLRRKALGLEGLDLSKENPYLPTDDMLSRISINYALGINRVDSKVEVQLKNMVAYYNYKYRKTVSRVLITSGNRTAKRQAELVYEELAKKNFIAENSMYDGPAGKFVASNHKTMSKDAIIEHLRKGIANNTFGGFKHYGQINTVDLGLNSNPELNNTNFVKIIERCENALVYFSHLTDSALVPPEGKEEHCYHMVFVIPNGDA